MNTRHAARVPVLLVCWVHGNSTVMKMDARVQWLAACMTDGPHPMSVICLN